MTPEEHKRRLAWQCRRGLLEVDVVLNGYLESHFLDDGSDNQQLFERLLESQDADLFEWFTERSAPDDANLAAYVRHILSLLGKPQ